MSTLWEKQKGKLMILLWIAVVLASIKSIFTDTGYDNAYTVAMSFRHLKGDGMFLQMWEPHQTSIFFTDLFMWIYRLFVPSFTGVMLYLQIVGTLFFAGIGILLYKTLRQYADPVASQLAVMLFVIFRAKQTPFPDFANLQIGFSMLLLLCLVRFINNQKQKRYLCFAAVCLCLEVLSYPSCLLAYIPVVILLVWKTENPWKNVGIFTAVCALIGGSYGGFFLVKIGPSTFINNLMNIFYSDSHSGEAFVSPWNYVSGLLIALIWLAVSAALAAGITFLLNRISKGKTVFLPLYGLTLLVSEFLLLVLQKKTGLDWTCSFYILPVFVMVLSCFTYKQMGEGEKTLWLGGNLFALFSFLSTWLLTDLGLITMVSYMVVGGVVSFTALRHLRKQAVIFLFFLCSLITMHRGLVVWGYANKANIWMAWDVDTIVRSGPSMGVVCDYANYYKITHDGEDHPLFVKPGDKLFLVEGWLIDSMEYLLTDAQISNYSTIDTPIYNEKLLDYLKLNPEKTPTIVAVSYPYGATVVPDNTWIMQWVNENYEAVGEGRYWRYYRPKEGQK